MFLNNTQAEEFEDCARKRFWNREFRGKGLQSIYRDDNLDFGTIVHAGLGAFYSGDPFFTIRAQESKDVTLGNDLSFEDREKWNGHIEWIARILNAYSTWAQTNDDFTPIQIESEGCVVLGEICPRCGEPYPEVDDPSALQCCNKCLTEINHWVFRVDMAVNKGEFKPSVNILDHKTTGSLGENYLLSWHNSMQLWGYCYGYEKQSGMEVSGYIVNIIRKLKGIGLSDNESRTCPGCRNGSKKRIGCINCKGTGKVEKEQKDEVPFVREYESWNDYKKEIFVRQRLNTANRILDERERFKHEPDVAWPMNPKSCFKMGRCPYWKLCYTPNDPEKWYDPTDDQLVTFEERESDYVSIKQMAREEMT